MEEDIFSATSEIELPKNYAVEEAGSFLNQIILGDCIEGLRFLPSQSIDLIVTDPPYLAHYKDRGGRRIFNDDNSKWLYPAFSEAFRVLKNDSFCFSFYGWHKAEKFLSAWKECGFRPVGHFVCVKAYASSVGFTKMEHEAAYLLAKGNPAKPQNPLPDVLPWVYTGNKFHPTQKPISALMPIIKAYSAPGAVVLDPFGGSGSTAIAARRAGRRFVLFEKDESYYNAAMSRLRMDSQSA